MSDDLRYYELLFEDVQSDPFLCEADDFKGVPRLFAYKPERMTTWPTDPPLFIGEGRVVEDYLGSVENGWFLFSAATVELFRELNVDGVDFHPVRIFRKDCDAQLPGFFVMHVWKTIAALDRELADWEPVHYEAEELLVIYDYVIKAETVIGVDIFRPAEEVVSIFVSNRLRDAIVDAKLTGFRFVPIKVSH